MWSVATNLVKSINISFRMPCYKAVPFWATAEHSFHSFSSTPTSRNEQSSRNEEWTRNTPSSSPFFSKSSAVSSHVPFKHESLIFFHKNTILSSDFIGILHLWKIFLIFVHTNIYCVAPWCPFLTDYARIFSVERWQRRSLWQEKWIERCLSPTIVDLYSYFD